MKDNMERLIVETEDERGVLLKGRNSMPSSLIEPIEFFFIKIQRTVSVITNSYIT